MPMTTLNISLPDSMRAFIEAQVAQGSYGTASEYVRALVREAQQREAQTQLEAKLLEALREPTAEMTPERWQELQRQARAARKQRRQA